MKNAALLMFLLGTGAIVLLLAGRLIFGYARSQAFGRGESGTVSGDQQFHRIG